MGQLEGCQRIPKKILRSDGRCFGDPKDTIDTKQLKNHVYLLWFGHTSALLLKKKMIRKGHFPRPGESDPYAHQNSRRDISQVMVPIKLVITSILNLNSGYVAVVGLVRLARSWRDVGEGGGAVVGGGGGEPGG